MRVMAGRWGDRVSVRVAATVFGSPTSPERINRHLGEERDRDRAGSSRGYNLSVVIAGIADENRYEAVGTGWPLGREAW